MSDIPSEVFHNIFCRVPAESLLLVRGVCKSWRQIIDDPDFIKSHIKHHQSSSTTSLGQLLIRNEMGGRLSSLSLDSINFDNGNQTIEATPVKNLIRPGLPRLTPLPIPSCNGLILITHSNKKNKIWVLWNPLTQEFYELPEYNCPGLDIHGCGLGYDCADDDYKVVRIDRLYHTQNSVYKTLVYSLKYDSWKWIKDCPVGVGWRSQGIYLNGALYWMSWDCIIVLDLSTEDYCQLPLPFVRAERRDVNLDVLGGCLVVSCKHETKRFDGWEMKENGRNISWTKLFSFPNLDDIGDMGHLRPITYSKSYKHVLLQHNKKDFFWLDTNNNSAKKIRMHGLYRSFSCQVWQGSLFRFENIVDGGEDIGAKRTGRVKKMMEKKRLKLDITIT